MTRRPLPVLLVLLVALAGCGASARQTALRTTHVAMSSAQAAFMKFDKAAQYAILATAGEGDDVRARIAEYRMKRDIVLDKFETAWRALVDAALDDSTPLELALKHWRELVEMLRTLTGGKVP